MAHLIASSSRSPFALVLSKRFLSTTCVRQSGHSRWSKIKHGKALQDAQKSSLYGQLAGQILVAARRGGSADPAYNTSLQIVIEKAKKLGLPKDNIEAALKKAAGAAHKDGMQTVLYEALGPGGVPCIIECMTDNPTRTIMRVREHVHRSGGRLADVKYLFEEKAVFRVEPKEGQGFEDVFELAVEGGAEDVVQEDGEEGSGSEIEVTAPPAQFGPLESLLSSSTKLVSSEVMWLPTSPSDKTLTEEDERQWDLLEERLEENADCVNLWRGD